MACLVQVEVDARDVQCVSDTADILLSGAAGHGLEMLPPGCFVSGALLFVPLRCLSNGLTC